MTWSREDAGIQRSEHQVILAIVKENISKTPIP